MFVRFPRMLMSKGVLTNPNKSVISLTREPTQTIADIKLALAETLGVSKTSSKIKMTGNYEELSAMLPKSQDELPVRSMKDSYDVAVIPLSSDIYLQEKYATSVGGIRIGRLLEDIDIFAVWVVMKYIKNPKQIVGKPSPYAIVTGGVDQISITQSFIIKPTQDILVHAYVTYVGTSSSEVVIWLEQLNDGQRKVITKAYFILVARDRLGTRSVPINKLKPDGDEEQKQLERAIGRMKSRQKAKDESLLKTVPDPEEQVYIHNIFTSSIDPENKLLSRRILPDNSVWMKSTIMSNFMIPQPEDKNVHQTIFGGLIMRMMLELAWLAALNHCKVKPTILHISDVQFRKPIAVGNLMNVVSQIVYTEENYLQLISYCEVEDIEKREKFTSNLMNYTMKVPKDAQVKKVVPETYQEAVLQLAGRREFRKVHLKDQ